MTRTAWTILYIFNGFVWDCVSLDRTAVFYILTDTWTWNPSTLSHSLPLHALPMCKYWTVSESLHMCLLPVCTMLETFTTKLIAQFLVTLRIRVFISSMIWNVRCCLILSSGTYLWCFEFAKFGTLRNTCCGGTNIRQCRSQEDQLRSSL